jgi:hypothetical protein
VRVTVDPRLARLAYRCWPDGCPERRTCCVGLAIAVSRREVRVIDSLMDELARVVPALRRGRGFANVFDDDDGGVLIEPRDDAGTCPFLFTRDGRALCAVHDLALRTGRAVVAVKPRACRHWPLVLERRGSALCITVDPSAQKIGCVASRAALPHQPSIRDAFAAEIAELRRIVAGR